MDTGAQHYSRAHGTASDTPRAGVCWTDALSSGRSSFFSHQVASGANALPGRSRSLSRGVIYLRENQREAEVWCSPRYVVITKVMNPLLDLREGIVLKMQEADDDCVDVQHVDGDSLSWRVSGDLELVSTRTTSSPSPPRVISTSAKQGEVVPVAVPTPKRRGVAMPDFMSIHLSNIHPFLYSQVSVTIRECNVKPVPLFFPRVQCQCQSVCLSVDFRATVCSSPVPSVLLHARYFFGLKLTSVRNHRVPHRCALCCAKFLGDLANRGKVFSRHWCGAPLRRRRRRVAGSWLASAHMRCCCCCCCAAQ